MSTTSNTQGAVVTQLPVKFRTREHEHSIEVQIEYHYHERGWIFLRRYDRVFRVWVALFTDLYQKYPVELATIDDVACHLKTLGLNHGRARRLLVSNFTDIANEAFKLPDANIVFSTPQGLWSRR